VKKSSRCKEFFFLFYVTRLFFTAVRTYFFNTIIKDPFPSFWENILYNLLKIFLQYPARTSTAASTKRAPSRKVVRNACARRNARRARSGLKEVQSAAPTAAVTATSADCANELVDVNPTIYPSRTAAPVKVSPSTRLHLKIK
jgi:hypothetical protein